MSFIDSLKRLKPVAEKLVDVATASISEAAGKLDDPKLSLRQKIKDMEFQSNENKMKLAKMVGIRNKIDSDLEISKKKHDEIYNNAKIALQNNEEDLARQAIMQKKELEQTISKYQSMLNETIKSISEMEDQISILDKKIIDAKDELLMLELRNEVANAKKSAAHSMGRSNNDILEKVQNFTDSIRKKESDAAAYKEVFGANNNNSDPYKDLQMKGEVDSELEQLKNDLNKKD